MDEKKSLIALDAGNTSLKLGIFIDGELEDVFRIKQDELSTWRKNHTNYQNLHLVVSSVLDSSMQEKINLLFPKVHFLNQQDSLPFTNNYSSPLTLGMDRICNVSAVIDRHEKCPKLVVDIGTCIKIDLLDKNNCYSGGSISPGLRLRFNSLHQETARLPLLDSSQEKIPLIGNSTIDSIRSGVQNGMQFEINGMMEAYRLRYPDLTIFVTGGDSAFFDFEGKNDIFVDENLTLKGIYKIYSFHAH